MIDDLEANNGQVAADRARASLSAFFAWAIDRNYLDVNPCMNIRARAPGGGRDRVLSEPELVAIWRGCDGLGEFACIVRLLVLLGQRRTEMGDLRWQEIDLAKRQIDLPERRTKNHRPHIVPLSDPAIEIIETIPRGQRDLLFGGGAGGFGGWAKFKLALDARIKLPPWRLHDIRRSFVTHVSELGFAQPHVVEAIVNHVSGSKAGVAGVYNKAVYLPERRQALQMWATHLLALVSGKPSNIVPLSRQQRVTA